MFLQCACTFKKGCVLYILRPGMNSWHSGAIYPDIIPGDPKKSIRVWSSISQQLFIKYKRNVLHRRNGKLT